MNINKQNGRFIVEFRLKTTSEQEHILDKRLEICRRIYNQCVKKTNNLYKEMIKTKKWRSISVELKEIYDEKKDLGIKKKTDREKELYVERNKMLLNYGFTEFSVQTMSRNQAKIFNKNIDSRVAEKIGKRLWSAWNKVLFSDGQSVHYQKYETFNSIEGNGNLSGMRFRKEYLGKGWKENGYAFTWKGLEIPVIVDDTNSYESMALRNDVALVRLLRRKMSGKNRYYVQIVFKGNVPDKIDKETGEYIHTLGEGDIEINIGLTKVFVTKDGKKTEYILGGREKELEEKIVEIQQKMDSLRRASNPDNYNEDGTIKKQGNKRVYWVYSNKYCKLRDTYSEILRKQAAVRRQNHIDLANTLIEQGSRFHITVLPYKKLMEKKKKDIIKADGSYGSKKMGGKYIINNAPSQFVSILKRKIEHYGGEIDVIQNE